jgi:hypothetical protein
VGEDDAGDPAPARRRGGDRGDVSGIVGTGVDHVGALAVERSDDVGVGPGQRHRAGVGRDEALDLGMAGRGVERLRHVLRVPHRLGA